MKKITRPSRPLFAYVGSYTTPERRGQGNGINVYRVDRSRGTFTFTVGNVSAAGYTYDGSLNIETSDSITR
mgnify:CR=1 FL=1